MYRSTNRRESLAEPEVWFRIVHVALDGPGGAPVAAYREQTVEIALGPKGAFENGNVGTLPRRVPADRVINALPAQGSQPEAALERQAEALQKAERIRAYVERAREAGRVYLPDGLEIQSLPQWLEWASRYAAEIDPLTARECDP